MLGTLFVYTFMQVQENSGRHACKEMFTHVFIGCYSHKTTEIKERKLQTQIEGKNVDDWSRVILAVA